MAKKMFPYSGFLSGIFAPEAMDKHEQEVLNNKLEYATLTGNFRETNQLIAKGAEPSEDLLMHAVTQKWTRFTEMFLTCDVTPVKEMSERAIKNADPDTLELLIAHRCPVSDDAKAWASLYGSSKIKETLGGMGGEKGPDSGAKKSKKNETLSPA